MSSPKKRLVEFEIDEKWSFRELQDLLKAKFGRSCVIRDKTPKPLQVFTVRWPKELHERFKKLAHKREMSTNNLAIQLLKKFIEEES